MKPSQGRAVRLLPRPHQRDAIAGIKQVLSRKARTKLVMACGSGKTLVEFAVADDYEYPSENPPPSLSG